jgi:amino acid permease
MAMGTKIATTLTILSTFWKSDTMKIDFFQLCFFTVLVLAFVLCVQGIFDIGVFILSILAVVAAIRLCIL